jgi:hypothetical protein
MKSLMTVLSFLIFLASGVTLAPGFAQAAGFKPPEECLAYTGDAHLNCLYAYIELQKNQLGRIEDELKAQRGKLGELSDKVESRASSSTIEKAAPVPADPIYVPVPTPAPQAYYYPPYYAYPPVGFGLYLGAPFYGYYGPRFYGPRYFGPRYFGGPRFYGPRGGFRRR